MVGPFPIRLVLPLSRRFPTPTRYAPLEGALILGERGRETPLLNFRLDFPDFPVFDLGPAGK